MTGTVLITGGAGFVGSHLASHYLQKGWIVRVLDNLSRVGVTKNLDWLKTRPGGSLQVVVDDVRSRSAVEKAMEGVDRVYHLAAQVAVTHSVTDPQTDFEINAGGTINVLESARRSKQNPLLFFTSTNKVYGALEDVKVVQDGQRYAAPGLKDGVTEGQTLDFHSPYGCSKGAADQYVRDYGRLYGLRTVVFRMSCIYGTRQFGNEDQGWVAHFTIAAALRRPVTVYGDGRQVRDILYISDLLNAFDLATSKIDSTAGQIYNIGGGPNRTISLLELVDRLSRLTGHKLALTYQAIRPGDQPYYVSGIEKAGREFGWQPAVSVELGVDQLYTWVDQNRRLFE